METRKKAALEIDPKIHEQVKAEIKSLNELADFEYKSKLKASIESQQKRPTKPLPLTLRSYSESALLYYLRNHVDPRNIGEEQDVLTEVRKLRNNVFSFMQVQERTYLMPFVQDVYQLQKSTSILEETGFDTLNLMEIFIDLLLAGLGLNEQEQEAYKAKAAKVFSQKKASRQPKNE